MSMNDHDYGSVWANSTLRIREILDGSGSTTDKLATILGFGFFSQFTSYRSQAFNMQLTNWLTALLRTRYGVEVIDLPTTLEELLIVPEATQVCYNGRKLSPDLLRYIIYVMLLRQTTCQYKNWNTATNVLEIGCGYGGLVRTAKSFCPQSRFWLTDIPESLRCAEIYLREAFPVARIVWLDSDFSGAVPEADFFLVPVAEATRIISGRRFDLAINVWSFGEMPNEFVDSWLKLIQQHCQVEWLFTINSFMAPVTPASAQRTQVGDWLLGLDDRWAVEYFEIDLEIHRCPLIRNFPKGIGLVARRVFDESQISQMREEAAGKAEVVLREDWVGIAATESSAFSPERPERMLEISGAEFDWQAISSRRLTAVTDYIGHFNMEPGQDGPFFRLWNDWRLNRSERSVAMLVAYLAMVGKTDLERRCAKEELFLLKRLPQSMLHDEYRHFLRKNAEQEVEYSGEILGIQAACDRAIAFIAQKNYQAAEDLFATVAAREPGHGDCWYYLACIAEVHRDIFTAAVMARHAYLLAPDYQHYDDLQVRLVAAVKQNTWLGDLWKRKSDGNATLFRSLFHKAVSAFGGADGKKMASAWSFLIGGDGYECFCDYATIFRDQGDKKLSDAFETAAIAEACLATKITPLE